MAISPNDTFTSGQILTAQECNQFPFGVVALASSTTTYTLTTTETIATGMTVTFTAIANRYYKITYFEPQAQTASVAANTTLGIRKTNATGTILNLTTLGNEGGADQAGLIGSIITTLTAGSNTIVGTAYCSSTTGAPQLIRDATRTAQLLVEDIGPA
jgi:hypothetical protein